MLRLDRMELSGFKSFSDRTELSFPEGITAVVGPNGCGKSNIGDAINWVLGEQSAKLLRGKQMADVIFNGTEARKPLGMAEVTLVFGGAAGLPHEDQGTIRITRRLFRSGESEYRLNGARARLMDIQELLREAKVGARTYATIEQGRIDQVLNAKPQERRALIEDAAGVSGYKHKRRLAELKLEATHANLLRVHDIVTEVARQINALKRQAAKARRYRRLRERLRQRESIRFARQALEMDRELAATRAAESAAREAESTAAARQGRLETDLVATRELLELAGGELRELSERQHRADIEIDRGEAQVRACRERIADSTAVAGQEREDALSLAAREAEAAELGQRGRLELEQLRLEQEGLETQFVAEQAELERQEREQRQLLEEIDGLRARQFESMSLAVELRNLRRHTEEAMGRSAVQRERLAGDHGEAAGALSRLGVEAEERERSACGCEAEVERLRGELRDLEGGLRAARARHDAAVETLAGAREAVESAAARRATLADVVTRFTGVAVGVKALLTSQSSVGIRSHGVVADYVEASREFESVAESYLEVLLPAVILEDDGDAQRAADFLRSSGAGRTSLISRTHPAGALAVGCEGNGRSALPPELLRDGRVRGRLRDGLKLRAAANGAVADRIGDAVLVDSLKSALELHRRHPAADYLTPDGDVVYASGVISAGGTAAGDRGLLAHRRRLEEATAEAAAAAARAALLLGEVESCRADLGRSEAVLAERRAGLQAAERGAVQLRVDAQRLATEVIQAQRLLGVLATELDSARAEVDPLETTLRRAVVEVSEAESSHLEVEQSLARKSAIHAEQEKQLKARLDRAAELRTRSAGGRQRREAREQELRQLEEQLAELRARRAQHESGSAAAEERASAALDLLQRTEQALVAQLAQRERLKDQWTQLEQEIAAQRQRTAALEEESRAMRTELEQLRERSHEVEVARTRSEAAREHLDDLCRQELGISASAALAGADSVEDADPALIASEIAAIQQKIERIGPVNMTAIEEFSELEERHAFLVAQRLDLEKSTESLRESIRRIDRQSRARFEEAFQAIRQNYQEVYQLLFSGGRADLRLEEGEDVLEAGIEILAQPPGKRLTGVHLLSGGEKALSAIALLFAIFRYQPSPFCLLDEVDAALDDANVARFMRVVAEYAKNTQFVVVTHNKLSMEAANLLYGVTMQERGVSKVVSLQLQ